MRGLEGFRTVPTGLRLNFGGVHPTLKRGANNHCAYGAGGSAGPIGEIPEKHPAGAKAQPLLSGICGTTKVMPCYKTGRSLSFSATSLAPEGCFSSKLSVPPTFSAAIHTRIPPVFSLTEPANQRRDDLV